MNSCLALSKGWRSYMRRFHCTFKCITISVLGFYSVPSNLISSVSLSPATPTGTLGSSVELTCTATLSMDVFGAMIKFEYGSITTNTMPAVSGTSQTNKASIPLMSISSAGGYTCTVTVTATDVCEEGGSEPDCPTKTSNTISLAVECEW